MVVVSVMIDVPSSLKYDSRCKVKNCAHWSVSAVTETIACLPSSLMETNDRESAAFCLIPTSGLNLSVQSSSGVLQSDEPLESSNPDTLMFKYGT